MTQPYLPKVWETGMGIEVRIGDHWVRGRYNSSRPDDRHAVLLVDDILADVPGYRLRHCECGSCTKARVAK